MSDPHSTQAQAPNLLTYRLDELSTADLERHLSDAARQSVALLPLGSVEPHGPHMPLSTDRLLSEENALRAAERLRRAGLCCFIAPSVAYGVTEYATGFCGAISLPAELFKRLLCSIVSGYLSAGFQHVCLINHHLEPGQLQAIQEALVELTHQHGARAVSAPMVVSRRWGRALGAEFKSGACHAGAYEGSMIARSHPELFQSARAATLPQLEISLSEAIKRGEPGFKAIGMEQAYTGAPHLARADEGERLYQAHAEMVSVEVLEALTLS